MPAATLATVWAVAVDTLRAYRQWADAPAREIPSAGTPVTDGGEIIDEDAVDQRHHEAHADYPAVETPAWPGRDLDVTPMTCSTWLSNPDGARDENGDPAEWLQLRGADAVYLEDWR
jgi:hypothetical protein